ncbi:hypothetical protein JDV09_18930 [Mycobacterium sp. Y57]|uniref:hypothetical protein n=1 Tax=Mycolicibacterium xanthum TaxID=2796469 RepID=UPI001C863F94|nr:hypothetical protein [Mycolicibacterium xanthum]MBX7434174.1 hypothetical protein [Mycolicibacterium xanthum]
MRRAAPAPVAGIRAAVVDRLRSRLADWDGRSVPAAGPYVDALRAKLDDAAAGLPVELTRDEVPALFRPREFSSLYRLDGEVLRPAR